MLLRTLRGIFAATIDHLALQCAAHNLNMVASAGIMPVSPDEMRLYPLVASAPCISMLPLSGLRFSDRFPNSYVKTLCARRP